MLEVTFSIDIHDYFLLKTATDTHKLHPLGIMKIATYFWSFSSSCEAFKYSFIHLSLPCLDAKSIEWKKLCILVLTIFFKISTCCKIIFIGDYPCFRKLSIFRWSIWLIFQNAQTHTHRCSHKKYIFRLITSSSLFFKCFCWVYVYIFVVVDISLPKFCLSSEKKKPFLYPYIYDEQHRLE